MGDFIEKAKAIEAYFEQLYVAQGQSWLLGLYMAKRWIAVLETSQDEEAELLEKVLNAESDNQGSGWLDLRQEVRRWLWLHSEKDSEE